MENKNLSTEIETLLNQKGIEFEKIKGVSCYRIKNNYLNVTIQFNSESAQFFIDTLKGVIYSDSYPKNTKLYPLEKALELFLLNVDYYTIAFESIDTELKNIKKVCDFCKIEYHFLDMDLNRLKN